MTLEGPRVLGKVLGKGIITNGSELPPSTTSSVDGNDWDKLSETVYVQRSYYDMSGYNKDFLTAFIQGVEVQEESGTFGATQGYLVEILSTERLDDTSITGAAIEDPAALLDLPGFNLSTFDQSQIIYARNRKYVTSTTWGGIGLFSTSMWGTCNAATSDKIHITRIWYSNPPLVQDQIVNLPPVNIVMAIIVGKEAELPFLMRQKRSYELAT
jgi:hypothetical protein